MIASDFDNKFDQNRGDIIDDLDLTSQRRPNRELKRMALELPVWMINRLDHEATRLGVTRQSIIKVWLTERLEASSG